MTRAEKGALGDVPTGFGWGWDLEGPQGWEREEASGKSRDGRLLGMLRQLGMTVSMVRWVASGTFPTQEKFPLTGLIRKFLSLSGFCYCLVLWGG